MPTTFEQELAREQAAVATVKQIKDSIKDVAENKGLTVETTDTPLSVLTKIDNSTIATPTGTINITQNGTVDVTNYASASVNVPSEEPTLGTKTITANGTYNASDDNLDGYSSVTVNVTGGESISVNNIIQTYDLMQNLTFKNISYNISDYSDSNIEIMINLLEQLSAIYNEQGV